MWPNFVKYDLSIIFVTYSPTFKKNPTKQAKPPKTSTPWDFHSFISNYNFYGTS